MTRRQIALLMALAIGGCGGAAYSERTEESTAGDSAPGDSGGGDGAAATETATTTTAAGGEAPAPPSEPQMMLTASAEWDELLAADQDLGSSLELSQPDCDAAGEHVARLCELAERICEIAEDTGDSGAGDRCTDGTARCERGRSAFEDACD